MGQVKADEGQKKLHDVKALQGSQVMETREYGVFVLDKRNRPINEDKVLHFMELFKKGKNFMRDFPGIVDEDFIILDGQHRFEACRRLGDPFFFRWVFDLSIDNVADVQVNAGWKTADYMHTFIKQNNMNYIILSRFVTKYRIPITTAVMLLSTKDKHTDSGYSLRNVGYYTGNFKVRAETEAHKIMEAIGDFSERGFPTPLNRSFITAVAKVMRHPEYNHKHMMEKMELFGASLLKRQVTIELYVRNLEELYNYKSRAENKIRFS